MLIERELERTSFHSLSLVREFVLTRWTLTVNATATDTRLLSVPSYATATSEGAFATQTAQALAQYLPGYTYNLTEEVRPCSLYFSKERTLAYPFVNLSATFLFESIVEFIN